MATYPIKMLKDESGTPFVPLVAPGAVQDGQGFDLLTSLDNKLEKTNIIAGSNITLTTSGNNITISSTASGASANIIDNLNQSTGGVGVLDAHQGYVLKGMIPGVQNSLTSTSTTDALSAYQGYLLNNRVVPSGGTSGQVLKKRSATDNDVEWGDAADPNAISGDGSIKKIIEITYEDYQELKNDDDIDPDTEYHILDSRSDVDNLQEVLNNLMPVSGSNADGSWTKFPDGTMICSGTRKFENVSITTAWGSMYESPLLDFGYFPQEFIEPPIITTQCMDNECTFVEILKTTKTKLGTTWLCRPKTSSSSISVIGWIAIGKWK